jgi:diamine N-acetyltransferase
VIAVGLHAAAPCWVADEAGTLLGCAWLTPVPEPAGGPAQIELAKLYVARSAQGRGIGARLLSEALAHAAAPVWLAAWRENTRAITFYQRHGFAVTGSTTVWVDDVRFDDVVMRHRGIIAM